jgi:hypothetical protein
MEHLNDAVVHGEIPSKAAEDPPSAASKLVKWIAVDHLASEMSATGN